ncbi:MAG: ABC transporter permease [Vulcanimicrobiaceae bacterium]
MVRAVLAFAQFELELFFKTLTAFFFTYLMPCILYGGIVAANRGSATVTSGSLLPYFVGLMIVFVSLYTLATQVVINREGGFYKRLLVTKINPIGISISNALRGYVLVLIGWLLLVVEARVAFGAFPQFNMVQGLIALLFAGGAMFLVAIIPTCFVKRSSSMFAYSSVLSYALVFFSAPRPPLGPMERYAHYIDLVSPSYYALNVLRAGFGGNLFQADLLLSFAALVGFMAVSLLIIRRHFAWL